MAFSRRVFVRLVVAVLMGIVLCNFHRIFVCLALVRSFLDGLRKKVPSTEVRESLVLTEDQCRATFPLLTKEIDNALARGPFQLNRSTEYYTGQIQGRIRDGRIFIITADSRSSREMLYVREHFVLNHVVLWRNEKRLTSVQERNAILHQLHRAIITSPAPLPDTIFALSILDSPREMCGLSQGPHTSISMETIG